MTRLTPIALATGLALVTGTPASAGGILLCNEYGCRSIVEFPLPVTVAIPPVVYMPANPPQKVIREGRRDPRGPGGSFSANRPPIDQGRPPVRSPGVAATHVAPPLANAPTGSPSPQEAEVIREAEAIEHDITAFCDSNPETPFCGKLGEYLRKHPRSPR